MKRGALFTEKILVWDEGDFIPLHRLYTCLDFKHYLSKCTLRSRMEADIPRKMAGASLLYFTSWLPTMIPADLVNWVADALIRIAHVHASSCFQAHPLEAGQKCSLEFSVSVYIAWLIIFLFYHLLRISLFLSPFLSCLHFYGTVEIFGEWICKQQDWIRIPYPYLFNSLYVWLRYTKKFHRCNLFGIKY